MTRRTIHSLERHYRVVEELNDKGKVIDSHVVKRIAVVDAVPREKWKCPKCGTEHLCSIGQRVVCKHDGLTRSQRRALKHKR